MRQWFRLWKKITQVEIYLFNCPLPEISFKSNGEKSTVSVGGFLQKFYLQKQRTMFSFESFSNKLRLESKG